MLPNFPRADADTVTQRPDSRFDHRALQARFRCREEARAHDRSFCDGTSGQPAGYDPARPLQPNRLIASVEKRPFSSGS